jgi:hypothetical protein
MKVDRRIKVEIESEGALYFPLRFEGEVSQRLDPVRLTRQHCAQRVIDVIA